MSNNSPILKEDFTTSKTLDNVEDLIEKLIRQLGSYNLDDFYLDYSMNQSYEINSRLVKLESLEFQDDFSLTVVLFKNHRSTSVSCHGLNYNQWIASIENGVKYLKYIDVDRHTGLHQSYDYTQDYQKIEKFSHSLITPEIIKDTVINLEEQALSHKYIINSEGAYAQLSYTMNWHQNSKGLKVIVPQSYYCCGVTVVASSDDKNLEVDSSFKGALDDSLFKDLKSLSDLSAQRAISRLDRRTVQSGSYPIVFSPRVSGHIFKAFFKGISGHLQYKKSSFLLNHKDKKVFPQWLSIKHQPLLSGGHYSFPIDSDGFLAKDKILVSDGVILDYILSLYSARRLGLEVNHLGGGIRNAQISTNAEDLESIINKFDKCIIVDEVMGTGMNLINGDYSMGVNGFFCEKGVKCYALKETAIAGNLKEMLSTIVYHGRDYIEHHNIRSGSLAIEQMSVSCGNS